jgi:hypothetical protein
MQIRLQRLQVWNRVRSLLEDEETPAPNKPMENVAMDEIAQTIENSNLLGIPHMNAIPTARQMGFT